MSYLGSWDIDDVLTFPANTHRFDTGAATDADGTVLYRVYEDETGTAISTGTMDKLDDANTTGFYSEQITLSAANGFEKGKCYTIYISATVNSVTGASNHTFSIGPKSANVTQIGGDGQSATDLKDFADDGYDPGTNKVQSVASVDAIAAGGITSSSIGTAAIDADSIASDAITSAKIATGAFTADAFAANALVAATFAASSLDGKGDWNTTTPPTAAAIVNEWETQSQADPTGFHVNVLEIGGTAQTANDNGADINAILVDTDTTIPGLIAALENISASDVNAQVLDVLNVDTFSEPGQGAPSATPTIREMLHYLYKFLRNKKVQDATTTEIYDDAGTTVDHKITVSDDGTDFTATEVVSGP